MPSTKPNSAAEVLSSITGKRISAATSSLTAYALTFDDGSSILIEAEGSQDDAQINVKSLPADALPSLNEAVCAVDWSWIIGSKIDAAKLSSLRVQFNLNPAGPLSISLGMWQAKPFLTFMPYKAIS